ncbi:hypothetical protein O6H91_10G077400 [Diphasiastrum complanatum]|uniref:Uncharacterized protein n=2 Tax=Diphasiastrum complanatum TaxID=34168 RepID=A0ACC2CIC8_DIPCM|nr:hypothetical protein O6H91_19G051800 [Diphasiastrum complanatum]KAJ7541799.1 hypothetical protein O6H91_10G077400 [Diphasiastrum complanatum]
MWLWDLIKASKGTWPNQGLERSGEPALNRRPGWQEAWTIGRTCRNFLELCKAGYYDGVYFHKIIPGFMCQTGDPSGTGKGGTSIYGPRFDDEMSAKCNHNKKGIVSMANSGRNTNTSQFFITFKPCPHLDGRHTVFGEVKDSSFVVMDKIQLVEVKNGRPVYPVKLYVAEVTNDPWEGVCLPFGAAIPVKPLISTAGPSCSIQ